MKILKFRNRMGNDFYADYKCEQCGHILYDKSGYNDNNYFTNVLPNAICPECDKSSKGETKEEQIKRLQEEKGYNSYYYRIV